MDAVRGNVQTEREHLWKELINVRTAFRQALIDSKGKISDTEYEYWKARLGRAQREWSNYLVKMSEPESLA